MPMSPYVFPGELCFGTLGLLDGREIGLLDTRSAAVPFTAAIVTTVVNKA